jgi:hypothetical protein
LLFAILDGIGGHPRAPFIQFLPCANRPTRKGDDVDAPALPQIVFSPFPAHGDRAIDIGMTAANDDENVASRRA